MVIKRNYVIPLRRESQKSPKYRRTNKAVKGVIEFLSKHMKSDNVKIGKHLNEKIWEHGIRNPPSKVEVVAIKNDEGMVKAELIGFEKEIEEAKSKKAEKKADTKKEKAEKLEDAIEETSSDSEKLSSAGKSKTSDASKTEEKKPAKPASK